MYNFKRYSLTIIISLTIFTCAACGRKEAPQDGDRKVVAEINNYKLTVTDFMSEARDKIPAHISGEDYEEAKESLADDIIMKKVLLQEAQAQNFDKDRAFVKEIERYWEQALLKLLYNKKSQEILRDIGTEADRGSRDIRVKEELSKWMDGLKSRSNIKRYNENLKAIRRE